MPMHRLLNKKFYYAALAVLFAAFVIVACSTPTPPTPPPINLTPVSQLPDMPNKPQPKETTFNGCPPEGTGGDSIQTLLKNRIDEGDYVRVTFDAISSLTLSL